MAEATGHRTATAVRIEIANTAAAATQARHWLREVLATVDKDVADDAGILLSELVTNSHLHTRTPKIQVAVTLHPRELHIKVSDDASGDGPPRIDLNAGRNDGGRGLREIVPALSKDWGVDRQPSRTSVWVTLATDTTI